jgi:hypothetical protein
MALEPSSIAAVQPSAAPAASSHVGSGAGSRFAGDSIEGMGGSPFVNLTDQWRTGNDPSMSGQQQNANQWLKGGGTPIVVTPRMSLAAASYPAGASLQEETGVVSAPLPADLQRGVGAYEANMRIISNATARLGSVINSFG